MYTQEEIRLIAEKFDDEVRMAQAALEVAKAKTRYVQTLCRHPDLTTYSAMGEPGKYCPDCYYQT